MVDLNASSMHESAVLGESISKHAVLVYTICLVFALLLTILSTLSIFLILMNAAYKV